MTDMARLLVLVGLDWSTLDAGSALWRMEDGRVPTADERQLIGTATWADLEAARDLFELQVDALEQLP